MATNQEAQTLEETLNKTDLGHVINENKNAIMIAALVVVLGIIGYSTMNYFQSEGRLVMLDMTYDVEKDVFDAYITDKVKAEDFVKTLPNLDPAVVGHPNLVPAFIESINKLSQENKMDKVLIDTVVNWQSKVSKSNMLYLFLTVRLASLYEDDNQLDSAIKTLESLVSRKSSVLKDKIHFDLGRLYLKKGDKATATERFSTLLVETEGKRKSEYSVLAKIYMNDLISGK